MGQINPQQEAAGLLTLVQDLKILSRSEARSVYDGGDWESALSQMAWENAQMEATGLASAQAQRNASALPEMRDDEE